MRCLTPTTLEELIAALAESTEQSRVIAGGTDEGIRLHQGKREPDLLIYPGQISQLHAIVQTEESLRIGAMVTMTELAEALASQPEFRAIADAAAHVGSPQIRNKATMVGNLCNASPAGDMLPVAKLYGCRMEILNRDGRIHTLPVDQFLLGPGQTALQPGQFVTAVLIARPKADRVISGFCKIGSRQHVSIARESMAALLQLTPDSRITTARLTLGAVANTPIRIPEAEALLVGQTLTPGLAEAITPIVAETINKNCRPANRAYKTLAAKGLTADIFASLLAQIQTA